VVDGDIVGGESFGRDVGLRYLDRYLREFFAFVCRTDFIDAAERDFFDIRDVFSSDDDGLCSLAVLAYLSF